MIRYVLLLAPMLAAQPFEALRTHCAGCHTGAKPAGGLDISTVNSAGDPSRHREHWERIARRIENQEMPPPGSPRIPAATAKAIVEGIEKMFDRLDREHPADPGRVTARRLNRFEFSNSVRDLLGIDMLPGANLPADAYGYGFDNIADVLTMNAALTGRYLNAATAIAEAAIPIDSDAPKPVMHRYLAERLGQDRQMRMTIDHAFPADGEYMLRTGFYQGLRDGTRVRLRLFLDGREVRSEILKIHYQIDRGTEAHGLKVTAGRHRIEAWNEVLPDPPYKGLPPYVEYIQVYGPLRPEPAASSTAYRRFFRCGHAPGAHTKSCARELVAPLARRAWRRPVTEAELGRLLALAAKQPAFELGMRAALQAILVSPHFLFRIERDRGSQPRQLDGYELASRLSYFLWSSIPDAELDALAASGQLRSNLRSQALRMLRDEKASAFVESFAGQWLQLRNLDVLKPDTTRFPSYNGELARDMRRESELFFETMLREDRPISDFLDAPFTFLNDRLANHYGISGIQGESFQRVVLDGVQRGGILTHASVLTVSSYPTRTSPVIRGKWILENILNQPPPPPPPNVPLLDETKAAAAGSMREQLAAHRGNAACAACHARMDPLGFGLENYDAIGRWRDGDASGELPNGVRFQDPAGLKAILKKDRDALASALAEKILTYATGRGMELRDRAAVRKLTAHVRANGYRLTELILGAVESEPFTLRGAAIQSERKP